MILPTIIKQQGEPCYPLKYWLFDKFVFLHKKKALMINNGWYKTLSGDWSNKHLEYLSYEEYRKMSLEELEQFIGYV